MTLPFLYVHGPLVWKGLLVVLVLVSCWGLARIRRWAVRRSARGTLASASKHVRALAPGWGTFRGRVVEGWAETDDYGSHRSVRRSADLVIEVDGERVNVLGDVCVVLGRSAGTSRRRFVTRRIAVDDMIFVTGTLAVDPDAGWTITKPESFKDGFVDVTGDAYGTPVVPLAYPLLAIWGVVFVGIWLLVLSRLGNAALERAEQDSTIHSEIAALDALAMAAAMPGTHGKAMDALEWRLRVRFERTEEAFQLRMELAESDGDCPYTEQLKLLRLDDALAAARRCATPDDAAYVLSLMGRYSEAARLAQRPYLRAVIAIAERRWRDAAVDLDRVDLPCVSALVRTFAGDANAFSSISEPDAICQVMRSLSLPPPEALASLQTVPIASDDHVTRRLRDQIAAFLGGETKRTEELESLDALEWARAEPVIWLASTRLRQRPPGSLAARVTLHAQLVITALIRGDLNAARDQLARARALDPGRRWMRVEAPLALIDQRYAPQQAPLGWGREQEEAFNIRANGSVPTRDDSRCAVFYASAIHDAWQGDGAPLARFIRTCGETFARSWHYIAVLPRVTLHRDELLLAMRFVRESPSRFNDVPFEVVETAARTREMSRAIGDTGEAARWQTIIDRHVAVLADPQVVIALLFLHEQT